MYDGTVLDEHNFSVLGGDADAVTERLKSAFVVDATLKVAINSAVKALSGPDNKLEYSDLEVAVLERNGKRRCFRRIDGDELNAMFS